MVRYAQIRTTRYVHGCGHVWSWQLAMGLMALVGQCDALRAAAVQGHTAVVHALAALGSDVNASNAAGTTPVVDAASRGKLSAVKALVELGARLEAPRGGGMSALHAAVLHGAPELVSWLLQAGADPNAPLECMAESTALHLAALCGTVAVVQHLLAYDANPNVVNQVGPPIHAGTIRRASQWFVGGHVCPRVVSK